MPLETPRKRARKQVKNGIEYSHCVIDCTRRKENGTYVKNGVYAGDVVGSRFSYYTYYNYIDLDVEYDETPYSGIAAFFVR